MKPSWMGGNSTINPKIHVVPETVAQQRATDEAFFEDWSIGNDELGLWLWTEPVWRAIVVRPANMLMVEILRSLGARRRANHSADHGYGGDWLVAASRWRELQAAVPRLAALRRQYYDHWFAEIGPVRRNEYLAKVAKRRRP